jgi:TolB-like protein/Flp pilus assembly protein TadD/tRNA A-37 threonylcarbamoyl transferase component Bud32
MGTTAAGHYELLERIASGGVGVLWKARDEKLDRVVALKFLSPELVDDAEARARFALEARAASSIDHPNICTIFEIGDTEAGELYIAMAYYGGTTLRTLLEKGPLAPERAVPIAIQIARGLAAAHEELIVHRDIKPGNVMLADHDTVKIVDFGLAKCTGRVRITDPTLSLGTPAYMSPEQIRGEEVDPRTDIWSLGVVIFEMLTGVLPFKGDTAAAVISSILNGEPRSLGAFAQVPSKLSLLVARALQKSPRARYQCVDEMISDLRELVADADVDAPTVRRRAAGRRQSSLAVLPFADMSADRDQEYLCDGLTEEILGALRRIPELRVASRTSTFQFKGRAVDIREIGHKLNVDTVLEGSVRRAGQRIRVSAQLVNVADGYRLWYERYDRDIEDVFAIQDEIAGCIASALELTLGGEQAKAAVDLAPENPRAWELYLQGRQFFLQHRRKGFEIARQTFMEAIEIDPGYARAWAGIANCHSFLRLFFAGGEDALREAESASRRAIELAPDLAEARLSYGLALHLSGRDAEATAELERAIELDPTSYEAHYFFGRIAFTRGDMDAAARHFERAGTIAPDAYDSWYLLGMACRRLGQPDRGRNADLECIEAVKRQIRVHPEDTRAWTMGAAVFSELGEPDRAAAWVERALAIDPDEPLVAYNAACVYTGLGRVEDALRCLEIGLTTGSLQRAWIANDPDLDPLRDDPRFVEILGRLGRIAS